MHEALSMMTLLQQFRMIYMNDSHKVMTLKYIIFDKKFHNSNKTNNLFLIITPNSKPYGMNCHHIKPLLLALVEVGNYPSTCTCGGLKQLLDKEESDCVMQFLMGLNESNITIRGSILMMSPLPNTWKTHALVLQHE